MGPSPTLRKPISTVARTLVAPAATPGWEAGPAAEGPGCPFTREG